MRSVTGTEAVQRREIAASWHRCADYGLSPELPLADLPAEEVDTASSLVSAAGPVLSRVGRLLAGTDYLFALCDHDGRVVGRYGDSRLIGRRFDEVSVRTGVSFREEDVGTNAIGTALELRQPVTIRTEEHFNQALRSVACIGHPIFHPITRRLIGVVDLSGDNGVTHPLVLRLVRDVVAEIETRLLSSSSDAQQRLVAAFRAASAHRNRPVVVFDDDVLLANRAAVDLLHTDDLAALHGLLPGRGSGCMPRLDLRLANGDDVSFAVEPVTGSQRGVILALSRDQHRSSQSPPDRVDGGALRGTTPDRTNGHGRQVAELYLVSGPPGSGRSTRAAELAEPRPLHSVPIDLAFVDTGQQWLERVAELLRVSGPATDEHVVCIEEIGLLPAPLLARLADVVRLTDRPALILTSDVYEDLAGRAGAVASMCTNRIVLRPLSQRRDELHALARAMITQLNPESTVRLTPSAVEALSAQPWPGNLNELRAVIAHSCAHRSTGDITPRDLPDGYRATTPPRSYGGLERAERDAIVRALESSGGNKVRAARLLGISRTTLYSRMRQLRVTG